MKFEDLITELSERSGRSKNAAKDIMKAFPEIVIEMTTKEEPEDVRISGFGKFEQRRIEPKENATVAGKTGLNISGKLYPKFKAFGSAKKEF